MKGTNAPDINSFRQFFGDVTEHLIDSRVEPDDIVRVNADNTSHPIYRVKVMDLDARNRLLTRANLLKDTDDFKDVYVSRDLTYKQRGELRDRRFRRTGTQTTVAVEAAVSAKAGVSAEAANAAATTGNENF